MQGHITTAVLGGFMNRNVSQPKDGWKKIARNLGFKLGPVVSVAKHSRNELRKESSMERSPPVQNSNEAVEIERTAMVERIGQIESADHTNQLVQIR